MLESSIRRGSDSSHETTVKIRFVSLCDRSIERGRGGKVRSAGRQMTSEGDSEVSRI
jgi:hypothetical protein